MYHCAQYDDVMFVSGGEAKKEKKKTSPAINTRLSRWLTRYVLSIHASYCRKSKSKRSPPVGPRTDGVVNYKRLSSRSAASRRFTEKADTLFRSTRKRVENAFFFFDHRRLTRPPGLGALRRFGTVFIHSETGFLYSAIKSTQ